MSTQQIPVDPAARVGEHLADGTTQVAPDLAYQRLLIVNVTYVGIPGAGDRQWVLVDTGVFGSLGAITAAVERRFGKTARPAAILLTHGHFDHTGVLEHLAASWDVPVYAHELEFPYLDGTASYPAPDPTVGGGLMASLSPLYPRGPVNVGEHLRRLPADGSVPHLPDWRWIHVPGHSPGQVAFWRESDRSLLAADAFVTTAQESVYAALTQQPELHGPPMYYTPDWDAARESVRQLAALEPELVLTGHGPALSGEPMRAALQALARDFDHVAVPKHGKYLENPANVERGNAYAPPRERHHSS